MTSQKIGVAIVGCGNIAKHYAERIREHAHGALVGFADVLPERARAAAASYGGKAYDSLEAALADPAVQLVCNLTIHHAHAAVITQCLEAGRHVYTEKPLALNYADARRLVRLAARKRLRLASAPATFLGEAQQTLARLVRGGDLGPIRLAYAEVNHGRIESWHPNPEPFYAVGVLWDVAVYPLTLLTSWFGPVRRVRSFGKVIHPDRVTQEGRPFHITVPDFSLSLLEFEQGLTARLTANFYVRGSKQGGSLELHGDLGRAYLGHFQVLDAPVEFGHWGKDYVPVPLVRPARYQADFARGLEEMTEAMVSGRPHRATGTQAAHVVEIVEGIHRSQHRGRPVAIRSSFTPADPMPWGV